MKWFFESNDPAARLLRTIVQGIISAVIGYLTLLAPTMPEWAAMLVIPVVMAILSPIMGIIGKDTNDEEIKIGGTDA